MCINGLSGRRWEGVMSLEAEKTPFPTFERWVAQAQKAEPNDPLATALATVDEKGRPSVRMVLMKAWGEAGFVFYTNLESRKGRELAGNSEVAMCLHWKSLRKQVRIEGRVEPVSDEEADAYFATRERGSQIGAWASRQSRPLESPHALEKAVAKKTLEFGIGAVPRPPFWSGFRLVPRAIEFWDNGTFRLHRRLRYDKGEEGWKTTALYP
jgi:pyridoxamine 5'-phosphate oxidase